MARQVVDAYARASKRDAHLQRLDAPNLRAFCGFSPERATRCASLDSRAVLIDEIRERFLSYFEGRDHLRVPSASLVPPPDDRSVLLTTAGMQPFKPYFRGEQKPPHVRLTSVQKCFRTPDIENVGLTARHLTFFEMLGNFSFGDYFKEGAIPYAWELSTDGYGLDPERIWITVFGGDDDLGLGPDLEAVEIWKSVGIPEDRIVHLGREDNFWQAGPVGPCGPCSELYYDRGADFGGEEDRPGDDTDRFLEFWNLVFMQYDLADDGSLTPLPAPSIDTGLGPDRLAAILQDVPSVYETQHFQALVRYGEESSGKKYGESQPVTRALRILADHGRGMTFLIADGVVPSNEDRGYVLRRIMRRAVQQGRVLGIAGFLPGLCQVVIDTMGDAYPELRREAATIEKWSRAEEESFTRTLEQGEKLLAEIIRKAKEDGTSWVAAEDAFLLHDTYGFPYELTKELLAGEGLSVDDQGFEELMERARRIARAGKREHAGDAGHDRVAQFVRGAGFQSRFVGYEATEWETTIGALETVNGRYLAKLPESPFYPEGGGQVSDSGLVETPSGRARVTDVFRVGDDQAVELELIEGELGQGESADARVERDQRLATQRNHTATHLLHAALRARLGTHVRQAGSYVGPDKLRFDFTHGERLSPEELADVQATVNEWILGSYGVRAVVTTRDEAERLGAMALFGEKYGDVVRMVEVGDGFSRELCGGTHVAVTGEVGLFDVASETSSASNVRRIEAVTGPVGLDVFRRRSSELREIASMLRVPEAEVVVAVGRLQEQLKEAHKRPRGDDRQLAESLIAGAEEVGGARVVVQAVDVPDAKALLELSDQVKQTLGDAAVVLGTAVDGRVHLVANFSDSVVGRGVKAGDIVKLAAQITGGGGGGRPTMAQAGGRDPDKLPEALVAAKQAIEQALR
ncbi:MAG: alanyl-tRNA synthetase [Thermoleophilales bacterium]|nr:alanyl-tRNA synthetase [Thermoleophilales bacterium]